MSEPKKPQKDHKKKDAPLTADEILDFIQLELPKGIDEINQEITDGASQIDSEKSEEESLIDNALLNLSNTWQDARSTDFSDPQKTDAAFKALTEIQVMIDEMFQSYIKLCTDNIDKLTPYIRQELAANKDNIQGLDEEIFESAFIQEPEIDPKTGKPASLYDEVIKRAQDRIIRQDYPAPSPSVTGKTYALLNDKVVNEMIRGLATTSKKDVNGQISFVWGVDQAGENERTPAPVYIASSYMGEEPIKTSKYITIEDAVTFDSVCTIIFNLKINGVKPPYYITPEEIWRKENGIQGNKKTPTPNQKRETCAHMDKMRFTNLYMDMTQEIAAHDLSLNDERIVGGKVDTYYIKADYVEVMSEKGNIYSAYRIDEEPFLYTYNEAKGHTLYIDYNLLDTSDTVENKGYTAGFRRYLLQQIKLMYRKERNNTVILYSTIYKETGIPAPEERVKKENCTSDTSYTASIRNAAKDDRDKITALLDSWVKKGWILGYKQTKKGHAYNGVDIELNPKEFKNELSAPARKKQIEKK